MSIYFDYFPKIKYNGKIAKDITRRVDFRRTTFSDPYAFLPYTIMADDRPEDIAYYYYGSEEYTWVVYYSISAVDPYYDWPMGYDDFNKFIIKKYETQANTTGYDVIAWSKNTQITDNIIHYKGNDEYEDIISVDTFSLDPNLVGGDYDPVRAYDYELEINDNKRVIQLLDRKYLTKLEGEMRALLK